VSSKLVLQCRNSLQGLSIHNRVQLFWVPGHCGIIRNEETDGLVGVGSKSSFCGPEPCLPVPRSLMTRVTKEWLSSNHLSNWNLVSGCRQSKVWIKRPCLKLARFLRTLSKTKLGVLIGLLTGHVWLNEHLHRMGLLSDPTCAVCGIEEESALHFICVCPTLANRRTQIFGKPIMSVSEYEEMLLGSFVQFAEKSGRFETHVQWNFNYGLHIRPN
jgi:hypothetical protein